MNCFRTSRSATNSLGKTNLYNRCVGELKYLSVRSGNCTAMVSMSKALSLSPVSTSIIILSCL